MFRLILSFLCTLAAVQRPVWSSNTCCFHGPDSAAYRLTSMRKISQRILVRDHELWWQHIPLHIMAMFYALRLQFLDIQHLGYMSVPSVSKKSIEMKAMDFTQPFDWLSSKCPIGISPLFISFSFFFGSSKFPRFALRRSVLAGKLRASPRSIWNPSSWPCPWSISAIRKRCWYWTWMQLRWVWIHDDTQQVVDMFFF